MKSILKKVFMCMIMLCIMVFIGSGFVKVNSMANSYEVSETPLTSVSNGDLVAWGTSNTMLASSISSNWIYCTDKKSDWIIFEVETAEGGFYLKNKADNKYIYSSDAKKVSFDTTNKTLLTIADKDTHKSVLYNSKAGYYTLNSTGIRPYAGTCYTDAHLYKVTSNATPSVTVSGNNTVKIGDTPVYNASPLNISEPYTTTWTSSNTDVATIDNDGNLTPVALGTTNLTATINETSSNEYAVKVWPAADSTISIADAIIVCGWCGTTASTDSYSVTGEITEKVTETDSKISIFISDGVNILECYKVTDGSDLEVGYNITVTGKLKKYNSTNEFVEGATYVINSSLAKYTVSYDSKGGTEVASEQVNENGYANEPISPTKNGYDFVYWYLNDENIEFDFDTTPITGNITLNAKWQAKQIQTDINTIDAKMSANYKYTASAVSNSADVTMTVSTEDCATDNGTAMTLSEIINGKSYNANSKSYNYSMTLSTGASVTEFTGSVYPGKLNSLKLGGSSKAGSVTFTLTKNVYKVKVNCLAYYDNVSMVITNCDDTPISSSDFDDYIITLNNPTNVITFSTSDSSKKAYSIHSLEFYYAPTFTDVDFRLRCGVNDDIATVAAKYADSVYGIEISDGENTKKYASNNTFYKTSEESDYDYVLISLGDFLNNPDRITMEFTVRAYITFEDVTYYSTETTTYSIQSIIKQYYNVENETLVKGLYDLLVNLGYDMAPAA